MKTIVLLGMAAIAACQLQAQCTAPEYTLSKDGIGPFTMQTCVQVEGKEATFTGSARNDSGLAIRQASWCVRGATEKTACAFSLWTTADWEPGETIDWNVTAPAGHGLPHHTVALAAVSIEAPPLADAAPADSRNAPRPVAAGCIIVKHKGTIARRIIWHTLIIVPIAPGAKYDLVDSLNVQGARPTYKGGELQALLDRGVRVIILPTSAKLEEVEAARDACK